MLNPAFFYSLNSTTAAKPQSKAAHCPKPNFSPNSIRPHTSAASTVPAEMTGYMTAAYSFPAKSKVQKLAAAFESPASPAKPTPRRRLGRQPIPAARRFQRGAGALYIVSSSLFSWFSVLFVCRPFRPFRNHGRKFQFLYLTIQLSHRLCQVGLNVGLFQRFCRQLCQLICRGIMGCAIQPAGIVKMGVR